MTMSGCDAKPPRIQLLPGGDWYYVLEKHNSSVWLADPKLQMTLRQHKCQAFNNNFSLPNSPSISFTILTLYNFFKCNSTIKILPRRKMALSLVIKCTMDVKALAYTTSVWEMIMLKTFERTIFLPTVHLSDCQFTHYQVMEICSNLLGPIVPVFSYSELEEATNDFNSSRVLGDGGFGTVYYGKLKDGREVAVKRLYEHNCKRMEQFVNEIEMLTRLRHNNLVTLYGCTSSRSRELLLVYEYILNGTLADHLHGRRAKQQSLAWPIRMNIAIETAGALAYLHASDVIHCDVKTNNILLDHNFSVKVADFGISRLFPDDVSHISTAPRGTPGYIDPKYHECYQLTSKSDVYSFGVVLVELISSMPAVDMNRHSQEINLANFAINKIVKCAFKELIDPSLLFDPNTKIWEMTTLVAELAFLCLQTDRDMRPTMIEVLDTLKEIQTSEFDDEKKAKVVTAPPFPESEDMLLLKQVKSLPSPNSLTDNWFTCSDITSTTSKVPFLM